MSLIKSITFNTIVASDKSNPLFILQKSIISSEGYAVQNFCGVNTIYTIDSRNNKFALSEDDISSNISFSIPTGNYTLSTFITALQTALNTNGTDTYTVTNNSLINKITISSTTKVFKIIDIANNCYYECGFGLSSAYALSQIASNTFDFSGLKLIYITSNSLGYGQSLCCQKNLNVICSINVDTPYLGVITYSPSPVFISSQISEINSIEFSMYDERFRQLTISNDWSLSLLFQI